MTRPLRVRQAGYLPIAEMITVVFLDAVLTLVIVISVGTSAPFGWVAGLYSGLLIGSALYMARSHSYIFLDRNAWREILSPKQLFSKELVLSALGRFDWALFAWSTVYLSSATATIIRAAGPIFFVIFARNAVQISGERHRYDRLSLEVLTYISVSLVGLAFVIVAQYDGEAQQANDSHVLWAGFLLAFFCAGARGFSAFNLLWGIRVRRIVESAIVCPDSSRVPSAEHVEVGTTICATILANIPVVISLWILSLIIPGSTVSLNALAVAVIAGIGLNAPGLILFRKANLGTKELGINALGYLTPAVALGLLLVFGELGRVRVDFIVLGVSIIIAMNLFLNFDSEERLGFNRRLSFKALVISMWSCGLIIYMRDEWFPLHLVSWSGGEYWGIIAVMSTMFTLLLAFRVTRLQNRTTFEEHQTSLTFRRAEALVRYKVLHPLALRAILRIDATSDPSIISKSYGRLRLAINRAWTNVDMDSTTVSELVKMEGEVDALIQSKQHSREFAELVSIVLLGFAIVGMALGIRSESVRWEALAVDLVGIILCSIIVFLIVNLVDLRRERTSPFVARCDDVRSEYEVLLREKDSPIVEQIVSVLVAVGIMVGLAAVLYEKWIV